jgi:hypothetical protein
MALTLKTPRKGQFIMKKHLASEHRSWICQPPLPGPYLAIKCAEKRRWISAGATRACKTGSLHSHAIPLLLENGADPNTRDKEGKTALDLADASNNLAAIAVLSVATKTSH